MELYDSLNNRERLVRDAWGLKLSCHDPTTCRPCYPLWKNAIRHELPFEISDECKFLLECSAMLEVASQLDGELLKLNTKKSDTSLVPNKPIANKASRSLKRDDGLYHLWIMLSADPKQDTHAIMISRAQRLVKKEGVKQYMYCYEYAENINVPHVHLYLKVSNLKHFGPSELKKFNGGNYINFQHTQDPTKVINYINKPETKVPSSELGGLPNISVSTNWGQ